MLTAYFDESYNDRTLCIGGWLCRDDVWALIEKKWLERLNYERRVSAKRGLPTIRRYHAADCANLKRDFKGWDTPRQIRLTKRIIEILGHCKPVGFAAGASLAELCDAFPALKSKSANDQKWEAYKLCMQECLAQIGTFMHDDFPHDRVTIIHDRGEYDSAAKSAFDEIFAATNWPHKSYFVGIMPGGWEDFIALQPADFLAYEGFKLTERHKRGEFDLRRTLQAVVSRETPIRAGLFLGSGLAELASRGMGLTKLGTRP